MRITTIVTILVIFDPLQSAFRNTAEAKTLESPNHKI